MEGAGTDGGFLWGWGHINVRRGKLWGWAVFVCCAVTPRTCYVSAVVCTTKTKAHKRFGNLTTLVPPTHGSCGGGQPGVVFSSMAPPPHRCHPRTKDHIMAKIKRRFEGACASLRIWASLRSRYGLRKPFVQDEQHFVCRTHKSPHTARIRAPQAAKMVFQGLPTHMY